MGKYRDALILLDGMAGFGPFRGRVMIAAHHLFSGKAARDTDGALRPLIGIIADDAEPVGYAFPTLEQAKQFIKDFQKIIDGCHDAEGGNNDE